jgi:GAF domain-containing protein/HAMP domain-containing protein
MEARTGSKSRLQSRDSLGRRVTFLILPLILIPFVLIGLGAYYRAREVLKDQASSQMKSALSAEVDSLREWVLDRQTNLYVETGEEELISPVISLIRSNDEDAREIIRDVLDDLRYKNDQTLFSDLFVTNINANGEIGDVLVSTNPVWEGALISALSSTPTDQIETTAHFDLSGIAPDALTFVTSVPMRAQGQGSADSVIIGVNTGSSVGALMDAMQVYWEQRGIYRVELGNTFLIMLPDVLIHMPRYATAPIIQRGIDHPIVNTQPTAESGTLEYTSADGVDVLGAYQWISEWNIAVVVELPQNQAFAGLGELAIFTAGLILLATVLITLLVPVVTRRSLRPLAKLTDFAERVAGGDLGHRVSLDRSDEIGRLGQSFNYMANELAQFYQSLEARVLQRTKEVRLAAEMARDVATSQDVDELMEETLQLISDRFTYYHVGIYLLDEIKSNAVLRAATSEGGKRMLNREHSLGVGRTGIVGVVTEIGEPRIMQTIGDDPHYYANPDLPETRSELTLPLTVSGSIIGALDIQSRIPNAFADADILVLQIIADQLAVAIENARLLKRQYALAEQRSKVIDLFNRLSQQTDHDTLLQEIPNSVREIFNLSRVTLGLVEGESVVVRSISSAEDAALPPLDSVPIGEGVLGLTVELKSTQEMTKQPLHELETQDPRQGLSETIIAIPLVVRDQVIGSLAFESETGKRITKDEIEALEIIASQVAIFIENASLLEDMQQNLEQMDSLHREQTTSAWTQLLKREFESDQPRVEYGFPDVAAQLDDPGLATEIELRGEVIGNLDLRGIRSGDWSDEDREILEAVADELATALEQARLLEEINRRVAQLQTAAEIARSASALMDLDDLLSGSVNLIQDRFNFYHVSIFLLDELGAFAILKQATGDGGIELMRQGHKLEVGSKSIIGLVTSRGNAYVANQTDIDPFYWPNPILPETKSQLGIPLKIGENVLGAIDVQHNQPDAFGEDDISVLQILADQVAVAVQNVRLFEQTLSRAEREKSVVEITSRIRERRNVESMLQTALKEMQVAVGARLGRIRLVRDHEDGDNPD